MDFEEAMDALTNATDNGQQGGTRSREMLRLVDLDLDGRRRRPAEQMVRAYDVYLPCT